VLKLDKNPFMKNIHIRQGEGQGMVIIFIEVKKILSLVGANALERND